MPENEAPLMLTKAQLIARQSYLGASDLPSIASVSPWGTPSSVFLRKRRGKQLELPPIVEDLQPDPDTCGAFDPFVETDKRTAGSLMEDGIVNLYRHRTGFFVRRSRTLARLHAPWQTATPDRLVSTKMRGKVERGLECKLVGRYVQWPDGGVAAHVVVQCQWSMHVAQKDVWDVCALIDGSEFRIVRVERDDDFIADLVGLAEEFWYGHVLENRVPPATSGRDALAFVSAVHVKGDGQPIEATAQHEEMARELLLAQDRARAAKDDVERIKARLCAACGDARALRGKSWTYSWAPYDGNPQWREVAEALAPDGAVPQALIDAHRGDGYRKPQFHPQREWKERVLAERDEGGEAA